MTDHKLEVHQIPTNTPQKSYIIWISKCSDPTSDGQVSVLKCHPWIGMLTHTVLEDL